MTYDPYKKIVYWSDEDKCFIGMCPELTHGGVHGNDPVEVFKELLEVVEEVIDLHKQNGDPLPKPKETIVLEVT
jgi:predicted RNase H-like HicB family nuclease